jgi:hypothetical protein
MAVLAGKLAMYRDMEFRGINQPEGLGLNTAQRDGGENRYRYCYYLHAVSSQTRLPTSVPVTQKAATNRTRVSGRYDHTTVEKYVNPNERSGAPSYAFSHWNGFHFFP